MTTGAGGSELERLRAWAEVLDDSNYYELLGVLDLADAAAIKVAFHEFALAFHPDAHADGSEAQREAARHVFRRGAEAYRVLSDPDLRARYDLALAGGHLRLLGGEPAHRVQTKGTLQSLEDLCSSPAAKLSARKADEQIGLGNLGAARRLLQEALGQEGYENPPLEERIEALDLALFAMGG
jgi:curved DNA-binding protein CbpA